MWRSPVARFVRDEEAVGSNPITPTKKTVQTKYTSRRFWRRHSCGKILSPDKIKPSKPNTQAVGSATGIPTGKSYHPDKKTVQTKYTSRRFWRRHSFKKTNLNFVYIRTSQINNLLSQIKKDWRMMMFDW